MNRRRRRRTQKSIPIFIFPAVIVAMGLCALGLSLALPIASAHSAPQTSKSALLGELSPDLASYDEPVASMAKRLSATEAPPGAADDPRAPAAVQNRQPVTKAVAPSANEVRPAVKAQSLGASSGHAASLPDSVARLGGAAAVGPNAVGAPALTGPYTVVIVPEGPPEVASAANDLQARLKTRGIDARLSSLDEAGRPDAVLVLGEARSTLTDTWVCDPGPAASAVLAKGIQGAAGPMGADDSPQTAFPCEDVHAGRARVPAVLMELSTSVLSKRDSFAPTADGLATAIGRYFTDNAASVRTARTAARLTWPATGPITSYYGPSHPLGIDIGQLSGNITAATDGTVAFAGGDPCCSYGRYVVIQSSEGIETLYAHLSSIGVRKGQKVRQGQVLGVEGCTGHCTGPHLHFEVYDQGKRQNPLLYLP